VSQGGVPLAREDSLFRILRAPAGHRCSEEVLQVCGVERRCQRVTGDCFEAVPAGSEVILLSRVLHLIEAKHSHTRG
jgi:hypothetical protein